MQKTVYNNKITELKLENTKQKYEIKRLKDNQRIIYHADNYGGEYDYEGTVHTNKQ